MLAYNAVTGFAMEVVSAAKLKKNSVAEKATRLFKCATWATVRFLHLCVPGQIVNNAGNRVLHLPQSRARKEDWDNFRAQIEKIESEEHRSSAA